MALSASRHRFAVGLALALVALTSGLAQADNLAPNLPDRAPAPFSPDPAQAASSSVSDEPDTWIFSGMLQDSRETFSGTLLTGKTEAQFELKLASGATCDGSELVPGTGLVRLSEIKCSDDRVMRALFVPQGGEALKVYGHVGEERFTTLAHLLGTKPPPDSKQTAAPTAPVAPEQAHPRLDPGHP